MEQMLILGSGPAGLSAAIYGGRAQLSPLLITGAALGGQAATTSEIENYPGFPKGVGGMELTQLMQEQAERFGARVEMDEVVEVALGQQPFGIQTHSTSYEARTLIVATGVSPRLLGVPGEEKFRGRGVSWCATCDGFFYKDKVVAVLGGGDAAVEEAIFLTRFARQVYIVHRRDQLRAQKVAEERARQNSKIDFVWNAAVKEIQGEDSVTGLRLSDVKSGKETVLAVDGVFSYIGTVPNTQLFVGQLELDPRGYVVTDRRMRTNVPGVFAAGDVQETAWRQVSTAVGSGAIAGMEAEKYIAEQEGHANPERQW